ncbi:MAG: hypothetical protein ABR499_16735 [Gemmatimonadaceae bacterium]
MKRASAAIARVAIARVAIPLLALSAIALGAACRSAPREQASAPRCSGEGLLLVRNYTGRVLEIYESGRGAMEFIGFASPGVTRLAVRGPNELAMVYHVREPSEGRDAVAVTWMRRTAVARPPSRLALELACT